MSLVCFLKWIVNLFVQVTAIMANLTFVPVSDICGKFVIKPKSVIIMACVCFVHLSVMLYIEANNTSYGKSV